MISSQQRLCSAKAAEYYNKVQWFYDLLIRASGGQPSLHYGLWWDDTKDIPEALTNGDRFVAQKLGVTRDDVVLDAGCGIGASTVYLAQQHGCRVTGVTVSAVQVRRATQYARRVGVDHLVEFKLMDYTAMEFPDRTFTKAFTQESGPYAADKRDLLKELYRVLVPGGRYVALDPYLRRNIRPGSEQRRYDQVMDGWAAFALERFDRFQTLATEAGFSISESGDVHRHTLKSSWMIWRFHLLTYGLVQAGHTFGMMTPEVVRHHRASIAQRKLLCDKDNLVMFGYVVADKGSERA
jgi:cyclopropane fatty-acyl-phospholipid synthase-like methyltransferase